LANESHPNCLAADMLKNSWGAFIWGWFFVFSHFPDDFCNFSCQSAALMAKVYYSNSFLGFF
jgi:hypothetical protein